MHDSSRSRDARSGRWLTRRTFLSRVVQLSASAAIAGAGIERSTGAIRAQSRRPRRIETLIEDLTHSTRADFARGRGRGVSIVSGSEAAGLQGRRGSEFTSARLSLPFRATHLGLHWVMHHGSVDGVQVDVRTSQDELVWTGWQSTTIEAVTDSPGRREIFAALTGGRRARSLEYRVRFESEEPATLTQMTVTAFRRWNRNRDSRRADGRDRGSRR